MFKSQCWFRPLYIGDPDVMALNCLLKKPSGCRCPLLHRSKTAPMAMLLASVTKYSLSVLVGVARVAACARASLAARNECSCAAVQPSSSLCLVELRR